MASLRQIRQRIKSIQSSKQIMRAMQLVSASKLKRTQDKLVQGRGVMEFLDGLLQRVLAATAPQEGVRVSSATPQHPLCRVPAHAAASTLVVISSDAGLCGSYNTNIIQLVQAQLRRDSAKMTKLVFIGKRAYRYFTTRGYAATDAYLDLAGRPNPAKTAAIGRALIERFLSGSTASVSILSSRFVSPSVYRPTIQPWLPIQLSTQRNAPSSLESRVSSPPLDYLFEPSAEQVFEELLPRWAVAKFQLILLEAFTSEHSARMIAMKNATDNAEDLLNTLTRQRNRIRQAAITKELSEIVGTAEALR